MVVPASWQTWLDTHLVLVCGGLALLVLVLLLLQFNTGRRLKRLARHYEALARGREGKSLEELLDRHLARIDSAEGAVRSLRGELAELTERVDGCLQYVGLVRYDAFDDVGGQISFALAAIDEHGDGFLLNNLFGRDRSTAYLKPLRGGRSEIELSDEEGQALRQAVAQRGAASR